MKKCYELTQIFPYNAFSKSRFVVIRNIWTGFAESREYHVQNKRKLVHILRHSNVMCPHYVYREV